MLLDYTPEFVIKERIVEAMPWYVTFLSIELAEGVLNEESNYLWNI